MSTEDNRLHFQRLVDRARVAVRQFGLTGIEAEVVFIIDTSRSMYNLYVSGEAQELSTQLLALSLHFDDDGVIPAWAFGETARYLGPLTVEQFPGFIDRQVIRSGTDYQPTCYYSPVIDLVCRHFFAAEWALPAHETRVGIWPFRKVRYLYPPLQQPRRYPVFAVFVTAGDCEDPVETAEVIRRSSHLPIFWQFAGVTPPGQQPSSFAFLEQLDRLKWRYIDNCGFFEPRDLRDSFELFSGLLNEFPAYLMLPEVQAMLSQQGLVSRSPKPVLPTAPPIEQTSGRSGKTLYLE